MCLSRTFFRWISIGWKISLPRWVYLNKCHIPIGNVKKPQKKYRQTTNENPNVRLNTHSKWAISFSFLHCSNVLSGTRISVTRYKAEQKHITTRAKMRRSIVMRNRWGVRKLRNVGIIDIAPKEYLSGCCYLRRDLNQAELIGLEAN